MSIKKFLAYRLEILLDYIFKIIFYFKISGMKQFVFYILWTLFLSTESFTTSKCFEINIEYKSYKSFNLNLYE